MLPLYTTFFLYPSFTRLLAENTEDEAVRVGTHLASLFFPERAELKPRSLSEEVIREIDAVRRDLMIIKIKVFTPSGEIIYSTDSREIGEINRRSYFHETVAGGSPYSKVVRKESKSLEDQVMISDVVETYVPIMNGKKFVGAFEIYYDITKDKQGLDRLIARSATITYIVAFGLLVAVIASSLKAKRTIIERNRIECALEESEKNYHELYDMAPDMYHSVDRNGIIIACNDTEAAMLGYRKDEIIGRPITDFFTEDTKKNFAIDFPKLLEKETTLLLEREFVRKDGSTFIASLNVSSEFDRNGNFRRTRAIARDVSELKKMEQKLRELAERDPLTGIYNRRMLSHFLDMETLKAMRYRRPLSFIMFDLDHFKRVNDTFGHDVGDHVLKTTVDVVAQVLRKADVFARYGGEEFVVLSPETNGEGAKVLAEKIRAIIAKTVFETAGRLTVSLGVSVLREHDTPASLIKRADDALYLAKSKGRNRVEDSLIEEQAGGHAFQRSG
jgi:diguanylate cyclase (GGDEF)-like protein/PAS domain S-box-containing protein